MIDASFVFEAGTKILLNHFSFAQMVAGKTHEIILSLPSRDNSQRKILSFTISSFSIFH